MDEAVIGELVVLAGATVLPVKHMMKCRPNVELGLKIGDVCEALHTIGQEKSLRKELVGFQCGAPKVVKIGTAFQNRLQFLIGIDAMDNGEKHETCLNNTESKEQGNTCGHSERSEKRHNKNHGMQKMKVLLKSFVLELPMESGS